MGLDMFLFRAKRYPDPNVLVSGEDIEIISNYLYTKENDLPLSNKEKFELYPLDVVNFYKKEYDSEDNDYCCFKEVAYWRKANAIHSWFVDNVQNGTDDCHIHNECTQEILEELLNLCKKVRHSPVPYELLPTKHGFFFGDTEYEEWYFNWIDETIKMLEKILKETDFKTYAIYYESSW